MDKEKLFAELVKNAPPIPHDWRPKSGWYMRPPGPDTLEFMESAYEKVFHVELKKSGPVADRFFVVTDWYRSCYECWVTANQEEWAVEHATRVVTLFSDGLEEG